MNERNGTESVEKGRIGKITRRDVLAGVAGVTVAAITPNAISASSEGQEKMAVSKCRIKQSVCKWCYGGIRMEDFAAYSAKIGLKSIELVEPEDWDVLIKHGLICAMTPSHGIAKGLNRKENHAECISKIRKRLFPGE